MNALWTPQIRRSIEKHFATAYTSTRVIYAGQREDRSRLTEWVELFVGDCRWLPGRSNCRNAIIDVDAQVFCALSATVHRIDVLVGLVVDVLDRAVVEVKAYPETGAALTTTGAIRFQECKVTRVGMPVFDSGDVPLMQTNVAVEGRVEIKT